MPETHVLIAVTRNEATNERQSWRIGRPATHAVALNRFDGHADRKFYREAQYRIAGLLVDHFAVRSTQDHSDWRLANMIAIRQRDMVKIDTPQSAISRPRINIRSGAIR